MTLRGWLLGGSTAAGLAILLALTAPLSGQQFIQYGFESRDPIWAQGPADANFKERLHKLTDEHAHSGQHCETIQLDAETGTFIYYTYNPGKAAISEELSVSVWVRANRPGISLRCRAVLPRERDPKNLQQPLVVFLSGETYQLVGRWQQLTLRQPARRLREQQQLLREERKADVVVEGAYVDQIILNVYGGPGRTEVFTDDLEIGPLTDGLVAGGNRPIAQTLPPPRTTGVPAIPVSPGSVPGPGMMPVFPSRADEVRLKGSPARLLVGGERFFVRGIRHTGTPLKVLQEAGFNTVWLDESAPAGLIEDAVNLGFWIVPTISSGARAVQPGQLPSSVMGPPPQLGQNVRRFLERGGLLGWDLGSNLSREHYPSIARTAQLLRSVDPTRPLLLDVMDGFRQYAANIDQLMLGIHRWPLATTLELPAYRDWLRQRRHLGLPGGYCWTWIQSHLPDWFLDLAYDGKIQPGEPLGPQAEQLRLLTYIAIASGYQGVSYWSDRFLADATTGRDRLLALALLNLELRLLEPLLLCAEDPIWIDTPQPQVKAAILRTPRATVVLPMWIGDHAQIVPGQSALSSLKLTVPLAIGAQVWEVSPGHIRSLKWDRVPGGIEVTIPEFSLTSILVFTSDVSEKGTVVALQQLVRSMAPSAAQWAHDQASEELVKVEKVQAELERGGLSLPDAPALFQKSRQYLDSSLARRRNGDFTEAYLEAQRALRPLRILMRTQWERCMKEVDTPVASPYLLSFFTLPRHLQFWEELRSLQVTGNLLPDGNFETPPDQVPPGWVVQEAQSLDDVRSLARRVPSKLIEEAEKAAEKNPKATKANWRGVAEEETGKKPKAGPHGQYLMLQVMPRLPALADGKNAPPIPLALERTFLSLHSPAVRLPPGSLVRISVWAKVPGTIHASVDGALFYDSIGGEPLAVRLREKSGWQRYTVYRRVPASGSVHVVLAQTGLGTVLFDDLRIEPLSTPIQQAGYACPPQVLRP